MWAVLLVAAAVGCSAATSGAGEDCQGATCGDGTDGGGVGGDGSAPADGAAGIDASGGGDSDSGVTAPLCGIDITCTGDTVWSRRFGNSSGHSLNESITAVATDDDGYTVIAGTANGRLELGALGDIEGPGAGFVARIDPSGDPLWAVELQADTSIEIYGVGLDGDGNASLHGSVRGDLAVGGVAVLDGDSSNWDVFMVSFDIDGGYRFGDIYGHDGDMDVGGNVAVAPDGSIAITGYFGDSIHFGGNQLHATGDSDDVYVAVFEKSGVHRWSRRFGDNSTQAGDAVAFDGDGNVIVAARNYGTIDFGGAEHVSDGGGAIALAKLNASTGDRVWSRQFDDTGSVHASYSTLTADADGIYLGTYSSSADTHIFDFGLGPLAAHFFLVKFDQSGQAQWDLDFMGFRGVHGIVRDSGDSVVMVGDFQGTIDLGDGEVSSHLGSYDLFAAKYQAASGDYRWQRTVGDYNQQSGTQRALGVGVDAAGNLYVGGSFAGEVNFGDGILTSGGGQGGSDGYLVKLTP